MSVWKCVIPLTPYHQGFSSSRPRFMSHIMMACSLRPEMVSCQIEYGKLLDGAWKKNMEGGSYYWIIPILWFYSNYLLTPSYLFFLEKQNINKLRGAADSKFEKFSHKSSDTAMHTQTLTQPCGRTHTWLHVHIHTLRSHEHVLQYLHQFF